MSAKDPLKIVGTTIAEKYRVEKLVGEGGFAVVYRAQHTIWNKPVAIKFFNGLSHVPSDQHEQFQQAFIQEGALLTELSSHTAGIVQARDVASFTTSDGHWMPYMVLEWLEGLPLDELIEREKVQGKGPWELAEVARLLTQVCAALDVAHGKGIAHRDIKPANLFVLGGQGHSSESVVKILDFGVAKMMSENTELKAALSKTGMNITSFTPQYGAPEQFSRSFGATGPWTDVFALALVGVELLAGSCCLAGDGIVQLGFASGNPERRPTPRALGVAIPDSVEAVFARALAVAPADRFTRAKEFSDALGQALLEASSRAERPITRQAVAATELAPKARTEPSLRNLSSTTTPSEISPGGIEPKKNKIGVVVLVGGLLAGAAGVGVYLMPKPPPLEHAATAAPIVVATPVSSAEAKPSCPAKMVEIPEGQYFQGSDTKDAPANEKPAHNVQLASYCIDLYEVTAAEYKECSDAGKCKRAHAEVDWPGILPKDKQLYSTLCTVGDPAKSDHPANCVDWQQADTFCRAQAKRLPTEAEWEYATRGPDGRVYPWGDEPPTHEHLNACGSECVAWGKSKKVTLDALYNEDDGYPTTAPVGKFEKGRSRFGLYDVVGNVWEWVADYYADYDPTDKKDPVGPPTGERRVIRGGAWNGSFATWLRPSFRYSNVPVTVSHGVGFRCAKSK